MFPVGLDSYVGVPAQFVLYYEMTKDYYYFGDDPVWVIGDVHGCYDQYERLIRRIKEENEDAKIFQLGDQIDRGPEFLKVIWLSKIHGVVSLIGNHELNFLQEWFGYKQCRSLARRVNHDRMHSDYDELQRAMIIDYMLDMKNSVDIEVDGGRIWQLSHSPIRDISIPYDCGNASNYCMVNTPYDNPDMGVYAAHGHQHWNYRDIEEQIADPDQNWYNVDAGCCYGGELIALELNTLRVLREKNDIDYSNGVTN